MSKRPHIITLGAALVAATILVVVSVDIARSDKEERNHDRGDQDKVYQNRQSKNILPFADILKIVRQKIQGEIIETEFEVEDGKPIYEFKYIDPAGRVMELYVDAVKGKILKQEVDD